MISVSVVVASQIKTKLVVTVEDSVESDDPDVLDLFTSFTLPDVVGEFTSSA